jgi:cation/acetate symporter
LFKIRVWGPINFGLVFALSEFIVAWAIALIYSRKASRTSTGWRRRLRPSSGSKRRGPAHDTDNSKMVDHRAACAAVPLVATPALAQAAGVEDKYRWLTFTVFAVVIAITMYVTYLAAKRVRSASDFYTAGGGVSGLQNGWAIAGDYLSAASFLGIAGLISLYGYDGFMYSVGWLVAYITVLLLIAEPCRNIGRYTLSDILAYRNDPKKVRIVGALSTITVSTFYLTAQMVGGGVLVKT